MAAASRRRRCVATSDDRVCLDTNVCIAIINGSSVPVRARLKEVLAAGSVVCVSAVVLHELWYGVAKSASQESNTERVRTFLSGPFEILPWDEDDAGRLGRCGRCSRRRAG